MKELYLEIMEKALSVYTDDVIDNYVNSVKKDGLKEHGFPRLTANIGILMAHGRCLNMLPKFIEMMDLCCSEMPNKKGVANDFSVKEIVFAFMELDKTDIISKSQMDKWKDKIRSLRALDSYDCVDTYRANWEAFAVAGEYMRLSYLGVDTTEFIDWKLSTQVKELNENGLYRDPGNPIVYDFVGRLELSLPLFFGYKGKYASIIDENLKKAGIISINYQSVTGEMPFGGRSNQMLFTDAVIASVYEYEANRYYNLGDLEKAGEFQAAARLACKALLDALNNFSGHVKNNYNPMELMGCEEYAYFLKYMITVASFAYNAYIYCNDEIEPTSCPAERGGFIFESDDDFHFIIMNSGKYYAQFELRANLDDDSNGLGRLHRKNAPSTICLSLPFSGAMSYVAEFENKYSASICCFVEKDGKTFNGAEEGVKYEVLQKNITNDKLEIKLKCTLTNNVVVNQIYEISDNGVDITMQSSEKVGIMFPVFLFDGKNHTEIDVKNNSVSVKYKGSLCKYSFEEKLQNNDDIFFNRNGRYKIFKLDGKKLHIEID